MSIVERGLHAALALVLFLWFYRIGLRPVTDPDAWLHLRIGTFLNHGGRFDSLPDPWTPIADSVYIPTQWLPERVGGWVFNVAGLPGIALLRSLTTIALLLALIAACRQVADRMPATIAGFMAFVGTAGAHSERPQLAALVLIVVSVGAWWRTLIDGRPRWWLVPIAWLLANIHGLWLVNVGIGIVFCAVALWDARSRWPERVRLLWIPSLCVAVSAATPIGPKLLISPIQVTGAVKAHLREWQPLATTHPIFVIAATMLVLTAIIWVWGHPSPPPSRAILLLAAAICIMWSARTVAVGAVLAAGPLAEALQALRNRPPMRRASRFERRFWTVTTAILAGMCLLLAPSVARLPARVPVALTSHLSNLPSDALLMPDHAVSAWVMWQAPETQLLFDLRSEIYPSSHIEGYANAVSLRPGWQGFIEDSKATHGLFPTGTPIASALAHEGWTEVAAADGYTLLRAPDARP